MPIGSGYSGNALNGRSLKRMELIYKDIDIKFAINPEDYTQRTPNRASLTQTKGGAWIDAWGQGIQEVTLKGITGVSGALHTEDDIGYSRWRQLKGLFHALYKDVVDGEEITDLIKFYNHTDNEYWYCYPTQAGLELYRSKSRPNMYQYTINMWCIRHIGEPAKKTGKIGNPFKKEDTGTETITAMKRITSASGGDNQRTRSVNHMTEADLATATSTKTRTVDGLKTDCRTYYTELEPILGGRNGKISPITAYSCVQGLSIQSQGTVLSIDGFDGKDIKEDPKDKVETLLLSEVSYNNKVSSESYTLSKEIKQYSPDVLSDAYAQLGATKKQKIIQAVANGTTYDSTLFDLINKYQPKGLLTKTEVAYLKAIMLESMLVYLELYSIYNQEMPIETTLTASSMELLISNVRAVITSFTFDKIITSRTAKIEVIHELRKLEKILTQTVTDIVSYL